MKPFYKTKCSILILTVIFVQLFSCKNTWTKNLIRELSTRTLTDLQALLDNSTQMNVVATPNFGESSADDIFSHRILITVFLRTIKIYIHGKGDTFFKMIGACIYSNYNYNYCLILRTNSGDDANQLNGTIVKGSALFYRKYYFFKPNVGCMQKLWRKFANSDLGIVLRLASDFNIPSVRSGVKDCTKDNQDGIDAMSYLPDYSISYEPSKVAAYGYWQGLFYPWGHMIVHLILEFVPSLKSDLINFNGDTNINGSISNNTPFIKYNKETISYAEI